MICFLFLCFEKIFWYDINVISVCWWAHIWENIFFVGVHLLILRNTNKCGANFLLRFFFFFFFNNSYMATFNGGEGWLVGYSWPIVVAVQPPMSRSLDIYIKRFLNKNRNFSLTLRDYITKLGSTWTENLIEGSTCHSSETRDFNCQNYKLGSVFFTMAKLIRLLGQLSIFFFIYYYFLYGERGLFFINYRLDLYVYSRCVIFRKKIEDIPEERRARLLQLLTPRLFLNEACYTMLTS